MDSQTKNGNVLLDMKKICKSFSGIQVLFDVDFQLEAGEINCLIGENGAGKSTLVKVLSGVYTDYKGEVEIDGEPVVLHSPITSKAHGIHSIQQHRDLVPTMNAVENIFLGEMMRKKRLLDREGMRRKATELLDLFDVQIDLDIPVRELKVSEQGIIAICKAIAYDCKILLVDEASAPLDNKERAVLYKVLNTLKKQGKGIVYISHHMEEIANIGDRVTVLRGGKLVGIFEAKETDIPSLVKAMTGSKKFYERRAKEPSAADTDEPHILEYRGVSTKHIEDISFYAKKGEIVGFAGLEGSSKHMIAEAIYNIDPITSGEILVRGEKKRYRHPINAIRDRVGYLPTDRKVQGLVTCRSVADNIMITHINQKKMTNVSAAYMRRNAMPKVEELSIKMSSLAQLVEYLSGGNQQKVLLAKWLMAGVDILFLNGPTEGIDVGARADIYEELYKLSMNDGITLILFSSDIDELLTLCDRIYTMSDGRLINEYDAENVEKAVILTDILTAHKHSKGGTA